LTLYTNSVLDYYLKLNNIHIALDTKYSNEESPTKKDSIKTLIANLRIVRSDLYKFGVVPLSYIKENELMKDDPINTLDNSKSYDIKHLKSLIPTVTQKPSNLKDPSPHNENIVWSLGDSASIIFETQPL